LNAAIVRFEETVAAAIAAQLLDGLASDLPASLLIELQLLGDFLCDCSITTSECCALSFDNHQALKINRA
jgi:hypothetical protein